MLCMTMSTGEVVQIGDCPESGAAIKVEAKTGRRVTLKIATELRVSRVATGLIPSKFITGLSNRPAPRILASAAG